MYIPAHFAADDAAVQELLAKHGAADLVTLTAGGPRTMASDSPRAGSRHWAVFLATCPYSAPRGPAPGS